MNAVLSLRSEELLVRTLSSDQAKILAVVASGIYQSLDAEALQFSAWKTFESGYTFVDLAHGGAGLPYVGVFVRDSDSVYGMARLDPSDPNAVWTVSESFLAVPDLEDPFSSNVLIAQLPSGVIVLYGNYDVDESGSISSADPLEDEALYAYDVDWAAGTYTRVNVPKSHTFRIDDLSVGGGYLWSLSGVGTDRWDLDDLTTVVAGADVLVGNSDRGTAASYSPVTDLIYYAGWDAQTIETYDFDTPVFTKAGQNELYPAELNTGHLVASTVQDRLYWSDRTTGVLKYGAASSASTVTEIALPEAVLRLVATYGAFPASNTYALATTNRLYEYDRDSGVFRHLTQASGEVSAIMVKARKIYYGVDGRTSGFGGCPTGESHVRVFDLNTLEDAVQIQTPYAPRSLDWDPTTGHIFVGMGGAPGVPARCYRYNANWENPLLIYEDPVIDNYGIDEVYWNAAETKLYVLNSHGLVVRMNSDGAEQIELVDAGNLGFRGLWAEGNRVITSYHVAIQEDDVSVPGGEGDPVDRTWVNSRTGSEFAYRKLKVEGDVVFLARTGAYPAAGVWRHSASAGAEIAAEFSSYLGVIDFAGATSANRAAEALYAVAGDTVYRMADPHLPASTFLPWFVQAGADFSAICRFRNNVFAATSAGEVYRIDVKTGEAQGSAVQITFPTGQQLVGAIAVNEQYIITGHAHTGSDDQSATQRQDRDGTNPVTILTDHNLTVGLAIDEGRGTAYVQRAYGGLWAAPLEPGAFAAVQIKASNQSGSYHRGAVFEPTYVRWYGASNVASFGISYTDSLGVLTNVDDSRGYQSIAIDSARWKLYAVGNNNGDATYDFVVMDTDGSNPVVRYALDFSPAAMLYA